MKEATKQARRKALDPYRRGKVTVAIPFPLGAPMPVKDCPECRKPCPYTTKAQFACRECHLLFD